MSAPFQPSDAVDSTKAEAEALIRELEPLMRTDSKGERSFHPARLCELFGLRADGKGDSAERIAAHEAGHSCVDEQLGSFDRVQVLRGDAAVYGAKYEHPDFAIVGLVAGALGEEILLGSIEPEGCRTDLSKALMIALRTDGNLPDAVERVEAAIEAGRAILSDLRRTHAATTVALLHKEVLTMDDCRAIRVRADGGR